jgi:hypothetical protein
MTMSSSGKTTTDTWIPGRGAIDHYCSFVEGFTNTRDIREFIMVSNGDKMLATKIVDQKYAVS